MATAEGFWSWFVANEPRIREADESQIERVVDETTSELQRYCDRLWLELGGHPIGPFALTISAQGDTDYFARVNALVARAPKLTHWEFVAFQRPLGFGFVTDYDGTRFDPHEMWFQPHVDRGDALELRISSTSYERCKHERFLQGAQLVVACGLGELSAALDVGRVEVGPLPASPSDEGWLELPRLTRYVAWRRTRR